MESLDPILYLIIGGCLAGPLGWLLARDQIRKRLDDLRDKTESRARERAQREVREELSDSIRRELIDEFSDEAHQRAEERAEELIDDARQEAEEIVQRANIEARELVSQARSDADDEYETRRQEISATEKRLGRRESNLDERADRLDERDRELQQRVEALDERDEELDKRRQTLDERLHEAAARLESIADYTTDEARDELREEMVSEANMEAQKRIRDIESRTEDEARRRSRKILAVACQRFAGDYVTEHGADTIELPDDDMKGRIIGREGRNIRALEAETGVDVIVDDTPEVVVVSCFDPVRREIARRSLEKLVADGRIHPGRIEDVVQKTNREVGTIIEDAGQEAALELGIHGLDDELKRLVGELKFRTSYGQNMWSHSIEVGFLCGLMAAELGVDVDTARRAGLLHDIGKAVSHERQESHAVVGAAIADRHGEAEVVRNAIAAHHSEEPQNSVIAHLVIAADSLSGARPGARREVLGAYVERLEALEELASEFDGVNEAYAIQAGREIRVVVDRNEVDDESARQLSRNIATRVEEELTYPGQVKVTVIREMRAVEYAR